MIDGVFVPDGRAGAVQLDSAGHAFDGFPETAGGTWGSLWARAAEAKPEERVKGWIFDLGPDKQFMPDGRGVLGCHANAGATFDLEAMRAMHSGVRPGRFRAVAGLADTRVTRSWVPEAGDGMADLWIFVDGRLMFNRMKLRPTDGTLNLDVELGPSDRFLTLAVTDGGNGMNVDWFVFGDPVLTMVSTESENVSH